MKIIIITGPSGSGKTSLAKKLMAKLENCHVISTDDFYRTGKISNLLSKFLRTCLVDGAGTYHHLLDLFFRLDERNEQR